MESDLHGRHILYLIVSTVCSVILRVVWGPPDDRRGTQLQVRSEREAEFSEIDETSEMFI